MDAFLYALSHTAIIVGLLVIAELAARLWDRLTLPQHRRRWAPRRHPSTGRPLPPIELVDMPLDQARLWVILHNIRHQGLPSHWATPPHNDTERPLR
jgi:hypothetical protein